jgi:hypothetical protein
VQFFRTAQACMRVHTRSHTHTPHTHIIHAHAHAQASTHARTHARTNRHACTKTHTLTRHAHHPHARGHACRQPQECSRAHGRGRAPLSLRHSAAPTIQEQHQQQRRWRWWRRPCIWWSCVWRCPTSAVQSQPPAGGLCVLRAYFACTRVYTHMPPSLSHSAPSLPPPQPPTSLEHVTVARPEIDDGVSAWRARVAAIGVRTGPGSHRCSSAGQHASSHGGPGSRRISEQGQLRPMSGTRQQSEVLSAGMGAEGGAELSDVHQDGDELSTISEDQPQLLRATGAPCLDDDDDDRQYSPSWLQDSDAPTESPHLPPAQLARPSERGMQQQQQQQERPPHRQPPDWQARTRSPCTDAAPAWTADRRPHSAGGVLPALHVPPTAAHGDAGRPDSRGEEGGEWRRQACEQMPASCCAPPLQRWQRPSVKPLSRATCLAPQNTLPSLRPQPVVSLAMPQMPQDPAAAWDGANKICTQQNRLLEMRILAATLRGDMRLCLNH